MTAPSPFHGLKMFGYNIKALGNSFAVPVVRWLGERIQAVEEFMERTA